MTFEEELFKKYPHLFEGRPPCVECCTGWYGIVDRLLSDLSNEPRDFDMTVLEIKEKFGELRVYVTEGSERGFEMIEKATEESRRTCEYCGEPGKTTGKHWYATLCDKHKNLND